MNHESGDVQKSSNETEKEENQYESECEEAQDFEIANERNELDEEQLEDGNSITENDENVDSQHLVFKPAISKDELKKMLEEFETLCDTHIKKISDVTSTFKNAAEMNEGFQSQDYQKVRRKKKLKIKKKPKMLNNLIMISMMIVLLMQIHMYLLLYSKFNIVHQEIKEVSCAVYGKNCPDSQTAYQCLTNKMDFTEIENMRSTALLHRDVEEILHTINNISDTTKLTYYHFVLHNDDDNDDLDNNKIKKNDINFNKPPKTRTLYIDP